MTDITLEFAHKRVKEQREYMECICSKWLMNEINTKRLLELFDSATAQYDYFTEKLNQLENEKE